MGIKERSSKPPMKICFCHRCDAETPHRWNGTAWECACGTHRESRQGVDVEFEVVEVECPFCALAAGDVEAHKTRWYRLTAFDIVVEDLDPKGYAMRLLWVPRRHIACPGNEVYRNIGREAIERVVYHYELDHVYEIVRWDMDEHTFQRHYHIQAYLERRGKDGHEMISPKATISGPQSRPFAMCSGTQYIWGSTRRLIYIRSRDTEDIDRRKSHTYYANRHYNRCPVKHPHGFRCDLRRGHDGPHNHGGWRAYIQWDNEEG